MGPAARRPKGWGKYQGKESSRGVGGGWDQHRGAVLTPADGLTSRVTRATGRKDRSTETEDQGCSTPADDDAEGKDADAQVTIALDGDDGLQLDHFRGTASTPDDYWYCYDDDHATAFKNGGGGFDFFRESDDRALDLRRRGFSGTSKTTDGDAGQVAGSAMREHVSTQIEEVDEVDDVGGGPFDFCSIPAAPSLDDNYRANVGSSSANVGSCANAGGGFDIFHGTGRASADHEVDGGGLFDFCNTDNGVAESAWTGPSQTEGGLFDYRIVGDDHASSNKFGDYVYEDKADLWTNGCGPLYYWNEKKRRGHAGRRGARTL